MLIEVCANSVQSAANAQAGGAQRVELCQNLHIGGTTPSNASIRMARVVLDIELIVLIRPRAGDFTYSNLEFELMKNDIEFCKATGVDGVALGFLSIDGTINTKKMRTLVEIAKPLQLCFHRAFDYSPKPLETVEKLVDLGFDRILSSGKQSNAWEGKELLAQMQAKASGRIGIMAGGGITEENAVPLIKYTGIKEVHFSAKTLQKSKALYHNDHLFLNSEKSLPELDYFETDVQKVKRLCNLLKSTAVS